MLSLSSYYKEYFQIKINICLKQEERNIESGFHPFKEFSEKKKKFFPHILHYTLYTEKLLLKSEFSGQVDFLVR